MFLDRVPLTFESYPKIELAIKEAKLTKGKALSTNQKEWDEVRKLAFINSSPRNGPY